ncbi:G patch domain and ankyrin repeat-containing protein 1 [Echeneis naucrates]|uniref:G patch domain and ankyrin repeat-containing protein 1 n=1 Tax=Echeneis naucrates TaxID=173247 RepID=UPI0011144BD5|nr:G patch domain and ankyrin repeat-containing protein 1 [Echeneis naucrates]
MAALGFTPASQQDVFSIETAGRSGTLTGRVLSGEEARQFYETVMKEDDRGREGPTSAFSQRESSRPDTCAHKARRRRRAAAEELQHRTRSDVETRAAGSEESAERAAELRGLRLLRCAQEGDLPGIKELLSKGVDINFQDTFFWTAMMCASWSGQRAVVKLLLQHGAAWVGVVDMQGRDARDLALEAGHNEVFEELESYGRSPQRETHAESCAPQPQWCEVCCSEYSGSQSSHRSSTLHQFSLRRPPPTPFYCLPPSSNSYKMMVRCGWKPGTGLGPEGEGPHQPVPTVLKRDQKGLGYGQMKRAKVTHFRAGDHDAVKLPSKDKEEREGKGKRKKESWRKEQKSKNWERDFRASFYL